MKQRRPDVIAVYASQYSLRKTLYHMQVNLSQAWFRRQQHTQPFMHFQVQVLIVNSPVQVTLMTTQRHLWSSPTGGAPSALAWCPLQLIGILMTLSISFATALGVLSCTPPTSSHRPGGQPSALDLSG